jgi:hypothetical protein
MILSRRGGKRKDKRQQDAEKAAPTCHPDPSEGTPVFMTTNCRGASLRRRKTPLWSFPRKREIYSEWTPAFAGVTRDALSMAMGGRRPM